MTKYKPIIEAMNIKIHKIMIILSTTLINLALPIPKVMNALVKEMAV